MRAAAALVLFLSLAWRAWTLSVSPSALLGVSPDRSLLVCCPSDPCRRSYTESLVREAYAKSIDRADGSLRWCSHEHALRLLRCNAFESTFAWFEGEALSSSGEELRKACALSLALRPPESETVGSNVNLLRDSLRCLSSSVGAIREDQEMRTADRKWSTFLSLTSDIRKLGAGRAAELLGDVDAVEIRADRLVKLEPADLHGLISFVRSVRSLPILFTVRSRQQLGEFPDDDLAGVVDLLQEGLRAGVAWLDVEASLPIDVRQQIVEIARSKYPRTRLIGSIHDASPRSEAELEQLFHQADLDGHADIVKVVVGARGLEDCLAVHRVGRKQGKPYIGLCLGEQGAYSRVLNRLLTPVTHSSLPIAAPGQLSARDLRQQRERLAMALEKQFYLFGSPIKQSLSPKMHNAAFRELRLPYFYDLDERSDVGEYRAVIQSPAFGGASVTIPFKESITALLDSIDATAQAIGAVNTIVCRGKRRIGYNTDWLGIFRPLDQLLSSSKRSGLGVVVGSGGAARAACFALQQLGFEVRVVGRNISKAQDLAASFRGQAMYWDSLAGTSELSPIQVIISTLPAEAKLTLPVEVLRMHQPVVFDVVYKPARTPLLLQARSEGCKVLQGSTMLLHQGIEQFQLWCGVSAPRETMAAAVYGDEKFDDSQVDQVAIAT